MICSSHRVKCEENELRVRVKFTIIGKVPGTYTLVSNGAPHLHMHPRRLALGRHMPLYLP